MSVRHTASAPAAAPAHADAHGRTRGPHETLAVELAMHASAHPATATPARDGHDAALARQQRIRERAYAHYLQRGGVDGHDLDDWLQAEAQVG